MPTICYHNTGCTEGCTQRYSFLLPPSKTSSVSSSPLPYRVRWRCVAGVAVKLSATKSLFCRTLPMDFQSTTEIHYHHPQQTQQHPHQQQPQQQSWNQTAAPLTNLLQPPQSSSLAPVQDHHHHQQQQLYHHYSTPGSNDSRPQTSTSLSLNISNLSVASPTNLSPITPSTHPSTNSAVSPIKIGRAHV